MPLACPEILRRFYAAQLGSPADPAVVYADATFGESVKLRSLGVNPPTAGLSPPPGAGVVNARHQALAPLTPLEEVRRRRGSGDVDAA